MSDSLDSGEQAPAAATADLSPAPVTMKQVRRLHDTGSKFPKLEECAHFHYDFVELKTMKVCLSVQKMLHRRFLRIRLEKVEL